MRSMFLRILIVAGLASMLSVQPALADVPDDCDITPDTLAGIRQMLTAEDNGVFFEIWTAEEIACACIELYYNDPEDAYLHDRIVTGAVVLLAQTHDPRAVPVLIEAIDTHPPQALYNLGDFPTVEALNALVAHIRDENPEARDNAAEGLRRMIAPASYQMEPGWLEALEAARDEVGEWMLLEEEQDIRDYFIDAFNNLEYLIENAASVMGTE